MYSYGPFYSVALVLWCAARLSESFTFRHSATRLIFFSTSRIYFTLYQLHRLSTYAVFLSLLSGTPRSGIIKSGELRLLYIVH